MESSFTFLQLLHEYIFSGGIKKGGTWGGVDCFLAIPLETHVMEVCGWLAILVFLYVFFGFHQHYIEMKTAAQRILQNHSRSMVSKVLDAVFAVLHFGIWLLVVYYKVCLRSLVNLLQPCHLLLLLQGIAVVNDGVLSAFIGSLSVVIDVGALMGLVVPATEGLDQPYEKLFFYVQHYLMLVTGLYLLLRNNFVAYKILSLKTLVLGNLLLMALHILLYAPMDRYFQVNVQFYLCPSEGMDEVFGKWPRFLVWPTYRTTFGVLGLLLTIPLYYTYVGLSAGIMYAIQRQGAADSTKTTHDKPEKSLKAVITPKKSKSKPQDNSAKFPVESSKKKRR
jgi:hypothetical protein